MNYNNSKKNQIARINFQRPVHNNVLAYIKTRVETGHTLRIETLYDLYRNEIIARGKKPSESTIRSWVSTICNHIGLKCIWGSGSYEWTSKARPGIFSAIDELLGADSDVLPTPVNLLDKDKTPAQQIEDWKAGIEKIDARLEEIEIQFEALNSETHDLKIKKQIMAYRLETLIRLIEVN